jgi:hypothetical protein
MNNVKTENQPTFALALRADEKSPSEERVFKFKNEEWLGKMTAKAALKLGYISEEEFREWRKAMKRLKEDFEQPPEEWKPKNWKKIHRWG